MDVPGVHSGGVVSTSAVRSPAECCLWCEIGDIFLRERSVGWISLMQKAVLSERIVNRINSLDIY